MTTPDIVWPQLVSRSLLQRLRSSESQRIRTGELVLPKPRPVAPVRHHVCQWISGDPRAEEGPWFCGEPVLGGRPYCAAHALRVYAQPEAGSA